MGLSEKRREIDKKSLALVSWCAKTGGIHKIG